MNIAENPYYSVARPMLTISGHNTSLPKWLNNIIKFINFLIVLGGVIFQFAGLVEKLDNVDLLLKCIPPCCYGAMSLIISVNNNMKLKQLNYIFWQIQKHWDKSSERGINILHKYGRQCRFYIILYMIGLYGNVLIYMITYSIPLIMKIFKMADESKEMVNMFEFGLVPKKHHNFIMIFSYLTASMCTHEIVVGDTLFLITLEHASGVFKIIGDRLNCVINDHPDLCDDIDVQKKLHREIKTCVEMHRELLIFIDTIQEIFSTTYLFVFGFSIVDLSVTMVQYMMSVENPDGNIRFGIYATTQILHILFLTLPNQHLSDSSCCLFSNICTANWYNLSIHSRKLLLIIMRRGAEPTTLIVGRIFKLSVQFFTGVLRTSISYFTVLRSVRE